MNKIMSAMRRRSSVTPADPFVGAKHNKGAPQQSQDDASTEQTVALSSIQSCYRNAFYSTAVDVFTEFTRKSQHNQDYTTLLLKLIQSLHIFGFGIGLYQCYNVYIRSLQSSKSLSYPALVSIFQVMRRVWMTTSIVLILGAMALSTDWSDYLEKDSLYYLAPMSVLLLAMVVALVICITSPKDASGAADNDNTSSNNEAQVAKQVGFVVLHNMALCIAALLIDATTLLIDDLLDPSLNTFERIYGLTDVVQPVALAVLVFQMRLQLHQLVTNELGFDSDSIQVGGKNHVNLYKAQQGLYAKISGVFFSAATTKLVSPWLLVVKMHVLSSRDWCSSNNKIVRLLAKCND
jgi:hypothetical protein